MKRTIILLSVVLSLASCEQFRAFYQSPAGRVAISASGAYIVAQAIEARPEVAPVLIALADQQEGREIDLASFPEPLVGLSIHVVGALATHYGDDVSSALIVDSIRTGAAIANPSKGAK